MTNETRDPQQERTEVPSDRTPERGCDAPTETVEAFLHGWLVEVNWKRRTALLDERWHDEDCVPLRFDESFDDTMQRLARQFVEIRGVGQLTADDRWKVVDVSQVIEPRSGKEPFDLEAFLNRTDKKPYMGEELVYASEPFDVDDFIRLIHDARDFRKDRNDGEVQ